MSRIEALPTRLLTISGAVFCLAVLAMMLVLPGPASMGWLAAFVFTSAVPIGALCLAMMMRIIPGSWRQDLGQATRSALSLFPLTLVAWLPIMFHLPSVYEWARRPPSSGFKAIYLRPFFFDIRTLFILAAACLLAQAFLRGRSPSVAVIGLIGFVVCQSILSTDWLMSLDPQFHSSGFALYVLAGQMLTALALLVIVTLVGEDVVVRSALGALLLTAILLWAYLAFMQYFIVWSDNLKPGVVWFERRGAGIWAVAEYLIAFLHLSALLLLFFPPIRRSPRWLVFVALIVLAGRSLEYAWLVVPQLADHREYAIVAYLLSLIGLIQIAFAILSRSKAVTARLAARQVTEASP
ncbi:hypothetical protein HGP16_13970 [Rhizobium sp. P40RR-XXII]|uniref:hypothetical protein n=1 Tax=Rhizobium sp. P40RR-XXII TaxID=2726739 RepID=UPI00145775D4|nr:hypothetical protein [Rhizobium sp. P40RR-XXII]NLS17664.1 hypothetical protein [Rhizobium sp. P40RR-XXII]